VKTHFSDICDSEDAAKMFSGSGLGSQVELHAAATIESWKIILIELNGNCEKIGEPLFEVKCVLRIEIVMLKFLVFESTLI
jgi:hypothetical protein